MQTPRLPVEEIEEQFKSYSRLPFLSTLARIMGAEPTIENLRKFANKSPDRWAQTAAIMGRLGGYSEKTEVVNVSVLAVIKNASDSELLARITDIEARLKKQGDPVSEAKLINPPKTE